MKGNISGLFFFISHENRLVGILSFLEKGQRPGIFMQVHVVNVTWKTMEEIRRVRDLMRIRCQIAF